MIRIAALLLFSVFLSATLTTGASASTDYYVAHGYGYPDKLVAGPYDTYPACSRAASAINGSEGDYTYHCVIKASSSSSDSTSSQPQNYWVVYGYEYPAKLVTGPFTFSKCSSVAGTYNSNYTTYKFHCEIHY